MQLLERDPRIGPVADDGTDQSVCPRASSMTEQLRESLGDFLAEATFDREAAVVRNVALLGPESRNGYRYTLEAMQDAVPLYEGRPVFIDHPEGATPGPDAPRSLVRRKLRDYAGKVAHPRLENQRIRADLHLLGPNAGWLMSLIESAPADIGMSHVVLARRGANDLVQHIERVVSVDIVAFPATTRSFTEGSVSETCLSHPDAREARILRQGETGVSRLANEQVQLLLEQSRIPPVARTTALHQLLLECPDPKKVISVMEGYWQEVLTEVPRSCEKRSPAEAPGDCALVAGRLRRSLIEAIRGQR